MLSLAYITVEGADPLEQIEAARRAGFDAVGLRALQPNGRHLAHALIGNVARVAAVAAALETQRMAVLDFEVLTLEARFTVDAALPFLDLAAELGAREVQVVCEDPDLERAADRLAALAEASSARGLGTALEFMAFRTVDSLETALSVTARGGARILIDALHFVRSGGTIAALAAIPPDRLAYFQLCDAPAASPASGDLVWEARFDRLYPGEGALPLHAIVAALPAGLPVSIEVPRAAMRGVPAGAKAEAAMAWSRRLYPEGRQHRTESS